jgi:hypothetical protein
MRTGNSISCVDNERVEKSNYDPCMSAPYVICDTAGLSGSSFSPCQPLLAVAHLVAYPGSPCARDPCLRNLSISSVNAPCTGLHVLGVSLGIKKSAAIPVHLVVIIVVHRQSLPKKSI